MPTRARPGSSNKCIGTRIPRWICPDQTHIHGNRPRCDRNQHGRDNDSDSSYNWLSKVRPTKRLKITVGSTWNRQSRKLLPEESISEADDHLSDAYTSTPRLLEQTYRHSHPTLNTSRSDTYIYIYVCVCVDIKTTRNFVLDFYTFIIYLFTN